MRGKSGHVPFWPGGLDDLSVDPSNSKSINKGLRTVPPGFLRGLRLPGEVSDDHELLSIDNKSLKTLDEGEEEVPSISFNTSCHVSHIQQNRQVDKDDEHDIPLDQSNEVDSFLPTSVSALEQ